MIPITELTRRRIEPVTIEVDGEHVLYVRSLTQREFAACAQLSTDPASGQFDPSRTADTEEMILITGVCDQDGRPIWTEADLPAVRQLRAGVARRLLEAIYRVSGITLEKK